MRRLPSPFSLKPIRFAWLSLVTPVIGLALPVLAETPAITVVESERTIEVTYGKSPVLTYHKAEVSPPEGVDKVYLRSGFIYPIHAPGGGSVTGIHPEDHYHHLGLWHAWVNTVYGDHKPDFWNLGKKTGRVRFAKVGEVREQGFTVHQEQVAYLDGPDQDPTLILEESLAIDVATNPQGAYLIDYALSQTNRGDQPLEMPAYRYGGGIAYRAPHSWDKHNSDYLTSEGLDRSNSHATRARWVAMSGPAEGSKEEATLVILCHPENHDAPQRIRTWDKGPVFFNYVPVQEFEWKIAPEETVTLRYRLVVFDGKPDADTIEAAWQAYAKP